MAYFSAHREQLDTIASSPRHINLAVEEFVRVLSPLTHIGRVCPHGADVGPTRVEPDNRVSLCWASANYDDCIFERPEDLNLARMPNPHMGFGSGHHYCSGATQAWALLRSLIRSLAQEATEISILEQIPNIEHHFGISRQVGFERLGVKITGGEA